MGVPHMSPTGGTTTPQAEAYFVDDHLSFCIILGFSFKNG